MAGVGLEVPPSTQHEAEGGKSFPCSSWSSSFLKLGGIHYHDPRSTSHSSGDKVIKTTCHNKLCVPPSEAYSLPFLPPRCSFTCYLLAWLTATVNSFLVTRQFRIQGSCVYLGTLNCTVLGPCLTNPLLHRDDAFKPDLATPPQPRRPIDI